TRYVLSQLATKDAIVPEIWAFEIANMLFVSYAKRRRINEQQIREYLDLLRALPISVDRQDIWKNVDLQMMARKVDLAAYDTAYLDLALRRKLPLATNDERLKKAALSEGVPLLLLT
ncbi:MAG: type II toxin-antitoxin system VapC family toxin, partial [Bdellovibrionales bacterium]|nr:type II toxin-antitoxin system VapC family toxin [Bdellovibrionales bacterium]